MYKTRFAPSPTGPLHFGSLVAALGSFLEARARGGEWHVRIDDLDPPREEPGAAAAILRTLEAYGLHWDGEVIYQSTRTEAYKAALGTLLSKGAAFACGCSRKEIAAAGRRGPAGWIYPGTCRRGLPPGRRGRSVRVAVEGAVTTFEDAACGPVSIDLEAELGDFVIRRADGLFAYHLACVVDDAAAGFTHVVRGRDLLSCTPPQIHLQRLLGLPTPEYLHLPLAVNAAGEKLSKQTHAPPLDDTRPGPAMVEALQLLGLHPPDHLRRASPEEILAWALLGRHEPSLRA